MLHRADAAVHLIGVELVIGLGGGEHLGGAHTTGGRLVQLEGLGLRLAAAHVPIVQEALQRRMVHRMHLVVEQPGAVELAQDRRDATGTVHILQEVLRAVRGHLADAGHPAGQLVDVLLGEFQVVHGVDELLQTSHNGVAAAIGHAAEEHIKDGDLVHIPLIQVAGRHGQLVEICHGRKVALYV